MTVAHGGKRVEVQLGVGIEGIYEIDDRTNSWVADYWLYESWPTTTGFRPHTEIINEVVRQEQSDDSNTTEERNGRCIRWRHIRSKLHTPYDFRTFPFDSQRLELTLSDAEYGSSEVVYAKLPGRSMIGEAVPRELPGWTASKTIQYVTAQRVFDTGDEAREHYDCATFAVKVTRRHLYHLAKFFLPLFLLVAVAFSSFWIDADDLQSQIGIGVTCLLAVIAFQLTQTGSLPEVDYLTLADRVYVACYVAITGAIIESVYVNSLARRKQSERAKQIDRIARWAFGLGLVVAVSMSAWASLLH